MRYIADIKCENRTFEWIGLAQKSHREKGCGPWVVLIKESWYTMKLLKLIILLTTLSNLLYAQENRIRFELTPSLSASLFSTKTQLSYPSSTTDYTLILTNSFSLHYLKTLKSKNLFKIGIGIFTTGHKATYSENPPINFSGRTDIIKGNYLQLPLDYVFSINKFKIELGIIGNILINEKRKIGSGDKRSYLNKNFPFEKFACGLGTDFYFTFNLNNRLDLNVGLNSTYIIYENQLNIGLIIGLDYLLH